MDRNEGIVYNHILPGFGPDRAVRSLTKADCQKLIDTWTTNGQAPRGRCSGSTPRCGP